MAIESDSAHPSNALLLKAASVAPSAHALPQFKALLDAIRQTSETQQSCEQSFRFLMINCISRDLMAAAQQVLPYCDPHCTFPDGEGSFLHIAADWNRVDLVQWLLPLSDVHRLNLEGRQPLGQAAVCGSVECVRVLLSVNDSSHRDTNNDTPLQAAQEAGHWAVVDVLAPFSEPDHVLNAWEEGGAEHMPMWHAHLEREALEQTLRDSSTDAAKAAAASSHTMERNSSGATELSRKSTRTRSRL